MKRYRRELSDVVNQRGVKNIQIKLLSCFTFIRKTGVLEFVFTGSKIQFAQFEEKIARIFLLLNLFLFLGSKY